jgi:hypothetical protein
MVNQYFDEAYGGSAPENYERFFVPAIGPPWQRISFASPRFVRANGYWTLLVALVLSRGSHHSGSVPPGLLLGLTSTPACCP